MKCTNRPGGQGWPCLPTAAYNDGKVDCVDSSDESKSSQNIIMGLGLGSVGVEECYFPLVFTPPPLLGVSTILPFTRLY